MAGGCVRFGIEGRQDCLNHPPREDGHDMTMTMTGSLRGNSCRSYLGLDCKHENTIDKKLKRRTFIRPGGTAVRGSAKATNGDHGGHVHARGWAWRQGHRLLLEPACLPQWSQ